jgi:hypothetical protein
MRDLQGRFPAADLLKAAESIEAQCLWLRDSLIGLHAMTRHLVDRAPATGRSAGAGLALYEAV